ncbi:MAG: hypothetical protein HQK49_18550 [Oligoflexia bacterium]|nr:hypothetical protein [Oligoflexia bacterium]
MKDWIFFEFNNGIPSHQTIGRIFSGNGHFIYGESYEEKQVAIDVMVVPEMLEPLDIKGLMISVDVLLNTQKDIVAKIIDSRANCPLMLKGNHKTIN